MVGGAFSGCLDHADRYFLVRTERSVPLPFTPPLARGRIGLAMRSLEVLPSQRPKTSGESWQANTTSSRSPLMEFRGAPPGGSAYCWPLRPPIPSYAAHLALAAQRFL